MKKVNPINPESSNDFSYENDIRMNKQQSCRNSKKTELIGHLYSPKSKSIIDNKEEKK